MNTRQAAFRSGRGRELYAFGQELAVQRGLVGADGRIDSGIKGTVKQTVDKALAELWDTETFFHTIRKYVARAEKRRRPGAVRG